MLYIINYVVTTEFIHFQSDHSQLTIYIKLDSFLTFFIDEWKR